MPHNRAGIMPEGENMESPEEDLQTLPCGCVMGSRTVDGQRAFVVMPCSQTCEYYAYAIEESRKMGKPVITKTEPGYHLPWESPRGDG
jgi:hypothetical protein